MQQKTTQLSPIAHLLGGLQILITSTLLTGYISWVIREFMIMMVAANPWADDRFKKETRSRWSRDALGGTFGTVAAALVAWTMLQMDAHFTLPIIVGVLSFFAGWWACGPGEAYTVTLFGPGTKHGKHGD